MAGLEKAEPEAGADGPERCGPAAEGDAGEWEDPVDERGSVLRQRWDAARRRGADAWAEAQRRFKRAETALPEQPGEGLDGIEAVSGGDVAALVELLCGRSERLGAAGEELQDKCARRIDDGGGSNPGPGAGAGPGRAGVYFAGPGRRREMVPLFKVRTSPRPRRSGHVTEMVTRLNRI